MRDLQSIKEMNAKPVAQTEAKERLYEISFVLPVKDNQGADLSALHTSMQVEAVKAFGGITVMLQHGLWINAKGMPVMDKSERYTVAIPRRRQAELIDLAIRYARLAKQDALYIVDVDHEARIITL